MRVALRVLGREPDAVEQLGDPALDRVLLGVPWSRSGIPTIWRTVLRGLSDANGSWNTICISAPQRPHLASGSRA